MLAAGTTLLLLLAGCGGDDEPEVAASIAEPGDAADEGAADDGAAEPETPGGDTVTITTVDYGYDDVPALTAGTTVTITNASTEELHELVAIKLDEGDDRSVEELLAAADPANPPGTFAGVVVAMPGEDGFAPGPPIVLEEGRYLFLCAIPTGADPQAYMAAAQAAGDGPPQVDGGPPHFVQGMARIVEVEA